MGERPLRERRIVLFILAGVLVVVAIGLVLYYVTTADERAREDVEEVDALVAVEPIPGGTTGQVALDNGWIDRQPRTRDSVPDNIVQDANELTDLIAAADISAKNFITTDSFVSPARAASGGAVVGQIAQEGDDDPSPRQAVAVALDAEKTVDNNVLPGDTVNIVAIGEAATDQGGNVAGFLLTDVPVIGRQATTGEGEEGAEQGGGSSIIVSVPPDEVLKLTAAKTSGMVLWLTLIPRDYDTAAPPPVFLPNPTPAQGVTPIDPFAR